MKKLIVTLAMAGLVFNMACDDDDNDVDVTAPTITVQEPGSGEAFAAGGEIHFEARFEDDVDLATYNINIHNNFDGHTHGRIAVSPFAFDSSYVISGTSVAVDEEIEISSDATAGPYDFVVKAIDAAGTSTSFDDASSKLITFWITNEEMAHVHFQDATGTEVDEYEGVVGDTLLFYGEIEDEVGALDHVTIEVGHLEDAGDHEGHDHGSRLAQDDDHIYEQEFEVEGETSVMIQDLLKDAVIKVAQSDLDELEEGEHLYLIVTAGDEEGNISRHAIEIHFD